MTIFAELSSNLIGAYFYQSWSTYEGSIERIAADFVNGTPETDVLAAMGALRLLLDWPMKDSDLDATVRALGATSHGPDHSSFRTMLESLLGHITSNMVQKLEKTSGADG